MLATFAGGCFWCMVPAFRRHPGVSSIVSGYAGGHLTNPTYEQVCSGSTGHAEAVQLTIDPAKTSYEELLDAFWGSIDPLDAGGQFHDRGPQYRTVIFYHDAVQRDLAAKSKHALEKRLGKEVATAIEQFTSFYPAEEYHQDYAKKNPVRYNLYKLASGR